MLSTSLKLRYSAIVRSSKTSAQNACVKIFANVCTKVHVFKFSWFLFCVLVMGCENCENLDLAKISRYAVPYWHNRYCNQSTSHLLCRLVPRPFCKELKGDLGTRVVLPAKKAGGEASCPTRDQVSCTVLVAMQ